MFLLRVVGLLAVVVIGAGIVAYLFTRDRRYLALSWRVAKYALIFVLALFALLALERLIVMV
jgi:hypothetical protein